MEHDSLDAIAAADPMTTPERLVQLATEQSGLRARVAANPNAPPALLPLLAQWEPAAFLTNPVLPLLLLENPNYFTTFFTPFPISAVLALLRFEQVPPFMLRALQQHRTHEIADAARLHVGIVGEADADWEAQLHECFSALDIPLDVQYQLTHNFRALDPIPAWLLPLCKRYRVFGATIDEADAAGKFAETDAYLQDVFFGRDVPTPAPLIARTTEPFNPARCVSGFPKERLWAATHEDCPSKCLERLARDPEQAVRVAVASHPQTPLTVLRRLARDRNNDVLSAVAVHPMTTDDMLFALAFDPSPHVRAAVAHNPRIGTDILEVLALDTNDKVRGQVARHPHCWADLLDRLAQSGKYRDHYSAIACQPQTTPLTLERLARTGNGHIGYLMANRPDMTNNLRRTLYSGLMEAYLRHAQTAHWVMRVIALASPYLPTAQLTLHVAASAWRERIAIARNPNAADATLHQLARDGNTLVRAAARAALRDRGSAA